MSTLKKIQQAVLEGEADDVVSYVQKALAEQTDPQVILNEGMVPGMDEVAVLFRDGEMFVPEVLMSAMAMQAGNDILKPLLVQGGVQSKGVVISGTVYGDLHDIGKKIVGMMLEGSGFKVIDLGMDVPVEKFIGAIQEAKADLLCMSAMLTTTMPVMKEVVDELKKRGISVKVMVGGAPVTDAFAKEISAHYSFDAASAVELANRLISE